MLEDYTKSVRDVARARIIAFGGDPDEQVNAFGKAMPAWQRETHAAEQFIACYEAYIAARTA